MRVSTWQLEATVQAALYLAVIGAQFGTLARPELLLATGLWLLGRIASRADRQREKWEASGVADAMRTAEVECAAGSKRDLRLVSLAFGAWGVVIGSWLTLADVAWATLYPHWRRWHRRRNPLKPATPPENP
jgi:hypothetical protein